MTIAYKSTVGIVSALGCIATAAHAESASESSWMPWHKPSASVDRAAPAEGAARSVRQVAPAPRLVTITRTETRTMARLEPSSRLPISSDTTELGPRPTQWCGWYMRSLRGGGPEFNVAATWRSYGRAAQPQVGAVVVWDHHVGLITGRTETGDWIVKSGNWGGRVHEGTRSLAGATVRI